MTYSELASYMRTSLKRKYAIAPKYKKMVQHMAATDSHLAAKPAKTKIGIVMTSAAMVK